MVVLVIVLAVVAVVAIVLAAVWRSGLGAQRQLTATTEAAKVATEADLDAATTRATTAEEQAARSASEAAAAQTRATDAERRAADAEARAIDADARAAEAAARNGIDPGVLWALEQSRSERTWRHSVAITTDGSFLDGAGDPLVAALQVDLDAAREEVGAIVELEADVPALTPAGSVLVLRAAQELVARATKVAEETTLRVQADGDDVVVTVIALGEHDEPLPLEPLAIPASADLVATAGGVRILHAVAPLGSPE